jgi:hypothetical protein
MARIAALPERKPQEKERRLDRWRARFLGLFQPPQLKWAMAGAMACLLAFAALGVYQQRERQRAMEMAEGERAKEQVLLAMRIASAKLNVAQRKVQENSDR